jgi:hypothetical protein
LFVGFLFKVGGPSLFLMSPRTAGQKVRIQTEEKGKGEGAGKPVGPKCTDNTALANHLTLGDSVFGVRATRHEAYPDEHEDHGDRGRL